MVTVALLRFGMIVGYLTLLLLSFSQHFTHIAPGHISWSSTL
ncbi:hypothetical protein HU200_016222 [Digitaria exilis]|uniref:Uncharacterized protein n=1 Tax=Digitaria exilis TaxID=1010633 RepID=A0A835FAE6_9POAL|nr:hypothetical protein HU200_056504 [Digitaria exilis]KAF8732243.1 hypothetical protein HU200_016222 [Digitaria exilis]